MQRNCIIVLFLYVYENLSKIRSKDPAEAFFSNKHTIMNIINFALRKHIREQVKLAEEFAELVRKDDRYHKEFFYREL